MEEGTSYVVLARKYRPRTFEDLVGQTQVSQTLTRALAVGRISHAYLFTGPRGVGKTTAARLLAMALSCTGQGPKPCGQCPSCLEIQTGKSVDVVEVDGASNRGIDDVRSLRENVKYLPAKNPYKVYIIDEVHGLSKDAFNGLLKTLEEPPAHIVFIFATTEAHKVPETILSRCQRYDFRRIRMEDITNRLIQVSQLENIKAEKDAITIISRQAEGGLRDALGLMDQVIAFGGEITLEAVNSALGLINQEIIFKIISASLNGQAPECLDLIEKAYNLGYDFKELGHKLLELIRSLTLFKASPEAVKFLELTESETNDFKELTQKYSLSFFHRHFEAWLNFYGQLSRHPQPRWLTEAHLLKLSSMAPLVDLVRLTQRLTAFLESNSLSIGPSPEAPLALTLNKREELKKEENLSNSGQFEPELNQEKKISSEDLSFEGIRPKSLLANELKGKKTSALNLDNNVSETIGKDLEATPKALIPQGESNLHKPMESPSSLNGAPNQVNQDWPPKSEANQTFRPSLEAVNLDSVDNLNLVEKFDSTKETSETGDDIYQNGLKNNLSQGDYEPMANQSSDEPPSYFNEAYEEKVLSYLSLKSYEGRPSFETTEPGSGAAPPYDNQGPYQNHNWAPQNSPNSSRAAWLDEERNLYNGNKKPRPVKLRPRPAFNAELTQKLRQAFDPDERKAILDDLPAVKGLKQKLPGEIVTYIEKPQEEEEADAQAQQEELARTQEDNLAQELDETVEPSIACERETEED
ncbi:MAG: DNA polymerase III subunit gamma/tau [Deltaproteobacteria bacterium]|jgi:DNA polymerase-3 subunit gamma/tau|nr:DNA polymerase III subunit gamma/tau [Deltaproteobacteria bacterium]